MKQLLTLFAILFVVSGAFAQDKEESSGAQRKTVIKYLPINSPLQSYSFEIERMLNGKNAVTLGVGIPNNSSIIGKYGIKADENLKALELNTMHIRAAYRHYAGHSGLPRGFYIEPYLKYQLVKGTTTINIDVDENNIQALKGAALGVAQVNESFDGKLDANITTLNAGFQLGAQFLIAKRVAIDFYFLGLEAGLANADIKGTPTPSDPSKISEMKDKIQEGIDDLPGFLNKKITVTNDASSVTVKANQMPYPWLRGGISIGIAF
jgi:hypothetical protein